MRSETVSREKCNDALPTNDGAPSLLQWGTVIRAHGAGRGRRPFRSHRPGGLIRRTCRPHMSPVSQKGCGDRQRHAVRPGRSASHRSVLRSRPPKRPRRSRGSNRSTVAMGSTSPPRRLADVARCLRCGSTRPLFSTGSQAFACGGVTSRRRTELTGMRRPAERRTSERALTSRPEPHACEAPTDHSWRARSEGDDFAGTDEARFGFAISGPRNRFTSMFWSVMP